MAITWVGMLKKSVEAVNKTGKETTKKAFAAALERALSKNIPKTKVGPLMEKVAEKKTKAVYTDRTSAIQRGLEHAATKFKTDREKRRGGY